MDDAAREKHWKTQLAWMDQCFELFMASQLAQGRTRRQVWELLKRSWEIEDAEKRAGWAETARVLSRAR